MGVYIKGMKKPIMCITEDGFMGGCPMDRIWCMQRFAPRDKNVGECYKEMTGTTPSWCPLVDVAKDKRVKSAEQVAKEIPYGTVFTTEAFTELVNEGCFNEYDGIGMMHDGRKETKLSVWEFFKDYRLDKRDYPYVCWYNK